MRNKLAPEIGKGKYVLAEYGRLNASVPLGNKHLLYVSTSVTANHTRVIDRIRKLTVRVR